jgi:hypothetical protein
VSFVARYVALAEGLRHSLHAILVGKDSEHQCSDKGNMLGGTGGRLASIE